ncbi:hypothetical protein [Cystobacter ferrugineus]|uniref:hypothetical protein n=1 Tax=Cystobacter ferrugineus TaxID=83449 RepID=UPI000A86B081|nr:hypothetical protein [Cystobacter ferrugineus]
MKRHSPVPVDEVAEALKRAGCPTFAPWLDFQARYGGYVEDLGKDEAIWGLLHREPYWLPPGEVQVDLEGDVRRITCAEVHPSYDFWLTSSGEFFSMGGGGHYENFDVRVERGAVFWEGKVRGRAWRLDWDVLKIVGSVEELRQRVRAEMVPEASDKYSTCWRSDELILVAGEDRPLVWVDANRREHLLSQLGSRAPR